MTPGLAFFYGGLVRRKNVVNTMLACTALMGLAVVMWVLFGYSLSFGGNHAGIIDDFRWFALNGIAINEAGPYAATIPHLVFVAFQMMFAMITPTLITGSLVGRVRFKRSLSLFYCGRLLFIIRWPIWYGGRRVPGRNRFCGFCRRQCGPYQLRCQRPCLP